MAEPESSSIGQRDLPILAEQTTCTVPIFAPRLALRWEILAECEQITIKNARNQLQRQTWQSFST